VLDDSLIQRNFHLGRQSIPRAAEGWEWRQDSQRLLCRCFCDKLKNFFNVSQRKRNHATEACVRKGWMKALYSWERD